MCDWPIGCSGLGRWGADLGAGFANYTRNFLGRRGGRVTSRTVATKRNPNRSIRRTDKGREQRLRASRVGAAVVQDAFAGVITRRAFADQVGIHATTLKRWESDGIVKPDLVPVLGIPTMVFMEADVALGRAVKQRLDEQPGMLSVRQAAALVRRELKTSRSRRNARDAGA